MPIKFIAAASGDLTIELYDIIGFWGTSAKDFAQRLKAAKGKDVTLRINSPGGSVIEGTVIYNLLKEHDGTVTAVVDGMAASMAGVIAMAADRVIMPDNAFFMIHKPAMLSGDLSDADTLRKDADFLDKMEQNLINAYVRKTGKPKAMVETWFETGENWYSAAECLKMGVCDEIAESVDAAACTKFAAYYPEHQFAAFAAKPTPPDASSGGQQNQPMKKIIAQFASLPTTASEDEVATQVTNIQNRVAALEREKTEIQSAHEEALNSAKTTATQEATTAAVQAEKTRKSGLKDFAAKYNKDGDLNEVLVSALAGETTVDAFKDIVLDVINKRPTSKALKSGESKEEEEAVVRKFDDVESFVKAYTEANAGERRQLVRLNRNHSRVALKRLQKIARE